MGWSLGKMFNDVRQPIREMYAGEQRQDRVG